MRLSFDPFKTGLPVTEIIPSVASHLSGNNTLIVSAPPGAGKSTILPLVLLNEPWLKGKRIVMLEPRRLAAGTIAGRMASLLGEPVGHTVGYRIRFEKKISAQTRIEVVTEGILTRMLHKDNALEDTGLVIFDEFHERSIHADIAMALCRETQQVLRPDLRIMVMSATLDMARLSELLSAPVVESKGRIFPVDIIYTGEPDQMPLPEVCTKIISRALAEKEGDILAFLPGQAEILKCGDLLKKHTGNIVVRPLYGQLSFAEQNAAIMPDPKGRRKIVLATSIAETSLTIEGVKIVVDSGYSRIPAFDPKSGLSGLRTTRVSNDSADQRAGRAGRLSPGVCYRMWSKATQERIEPYRTPEMLESDLAPLTLDMAQWGVRDVYQLTWLTPPPAAALARASEMLHQLKALDNNKITTHGKQIHALPCHPRLAHMLILAKEMNRSHLATDIAALLEERDPLNGADSIDLNLRIEALRRHRRQHRQESRMDNVERVASSYRKLFNATENNDPFDPYETGLLLSYAYPERIACARQDHSSQFQLANGKMATVSQDDDLSGEPWLAVAQLDARYKMGKIFLAAPLNPKDLLTVAKESDTISWDTRKGGLIATKDLRIGSIVLQSRPILSPPEERIVEAVSTAVKEEGEALLNFNEDVEQWQNRVTSLMLWNPEDGWPDVTTGSLLQNNSGWLWPYLQKVKKNEDLKKINLVQVLHQSLDFEKQIQLDKLAPAGIRVPSGSLVPLKYFPHGEKPVLAVRLQEVFGLLETPQINAGKNSVVIHLLSPGYKPVQVTSDLRSFWANAYFEIRKELKRRYPKHSWPEDPNTAEAVSGAKRRPPR